jgi:hypothetical protein
MIWILFGIMVLFGLIKLGTGLARSRAVTAGCLSIMVLLLVSITIYFAGSWVMQVRP